MRHARFLIEPAIICAVMLALATAMAIASGLRGTGIWWDYVLVGAIAWGMAILVWMLLPWYRGEQSGKPPIQALAAMLKDRWLMAILLPIFIFPTFMTGFTVAKTAFPLFTGFRWDAFWTHADAALFGTDPWRITHGLFGVGGSHVLMKAYTLVWGFALSLAVPIYCFSAKPREVQHAFSALMLTWLVVGVVFATIFSSVGPTFADMVDPRLGQHFAPFHQSLAQLLPSDDPIVNSQRYLRKILADPHAIRAGGISAMPSMHLGVCTFLILLARGTWWRWPAMALWAVIWVGSVHFGYHYALDGIIAAVLTVGCWHVTAPRTAGQAQPSWQPLWLARRLGVSRAG